MKKHLFIWVAILVATILPRVARAADPGITLELTSDFWFIATLDDPDYKPGQALTRCASTRLTAQDSVEINLAQVHDRKSEIGRVRVGDATPSTAVDRFIVSVIDSQAQVRCWRQAPPAPAPPPSPLTVSVTKKKVTNNKMDSSLPAFAPGIDWYAFRPPFGEALIELLGQPTSCTVDEGGAKDAKCSNRGIDQPVGRLRLDAGESTGVRRMTVTFAKKQTVSMHVVPCSFYAAGSVKYIVAGATSQTLSLASKQPECDARLDRLAGIVAAGRPAIDARAAPRSLLDDGRGVIVTSIPADLPLGETTFTLRANSRSSNGSPSEGDELGTAMIRVIEPLSAGSPPKVRITYDLRGSDFSSHYFPARTNDDGTAAVTPATRLGSISDNAIWNTVSIPIKPPLMPVSAGSPAASGTPWSNADERRTVSERTSKLRWRIRRGLDDIVWKACPSPPVAPPSCDLPEGPGNLSFAVTSKAVGQVDAAVDLVEVVEVTLAGAAPPLEQRYAERVILSVTLRLANAVREESVVLPIRDRIYVDCNGARHNISDAEMRAINDEDVVSGQCAVVYLPVPVGKPGPNRKLSVHLVPDSKLDRTALVDCVANRSTCNEEARKETWRAPLQTWIDAHDPKAEHRRLNPFFGRQLLIVTVKRDGNEIASEPWEFSPEQADWMVLPHGAENTRGSVYHVEVRPAARPAQGVFYASATVDNGHADVANPRADLRFKAQLRSRGIFGFPAAVRMYLTVPVQLIGFRFPAATPELRNSSDSTAYQYMTPRTGLFGVLEPWDYDSGQNPWPLNPTIAGGLLALELTKPHIALSSIFGVQFKAPLIDMSSTSSQLATSATLGLFWEHGIQEKENRFLVTFGANILSLFAGK